jgi:hypothetical protein
MLVLAHFFPAIFSSLPFECKKNQVDRFGRSAFSGADKNKKNAKKRSFLSLTASGSTQNFFNYFAF